MTQRCWNKGPLGPSVAWGCFVLAYFDEEDETVKFLKELFGGTVVRASEVKVDMDYVEHEYALLWCWDQ